MSGRTREAARRANIHLLFKDTISERELREKNKMRV